MTFFNNFHIFYITKLLYKNFFKFVNSIFFIFFKIQNDF